MKKVVKSKTATAKLNFCDLYEVMLNGSGFIVANINPYSGAVSFPNSGVYFSPTFLSEILELSQKLKINK